MTGAIVAAAAALVSALSGVLLQALIGERRARAERERQEAERRRAELIEAVRNLLGAYVRFRDQQYRKIRARRMGRDDTYESIDGRYEARSTFTEAIDGVHAVTDDQDLLASVEEARRLVLALGDAAPAPGQVDEAEVARIGELARQKHTALRRALHP
ncbi:hypothetical protein [Streptomyces silaceus]|uniref:hypothetical protein n=1 Tax=Streptomyces silaceus TaxID=545123 RepID=UPI0006EB63D4|nr:hypothetical protein [Streptomyces silaceus]